MYDFEFLRNSTPVGGKLVLYIYKSGIWRKRVRLELSRQAKRPVELRDKAGILSALMGMDLFAAELALVGDLGRASDDSLAGLLLDALENGEHNFVGVFVSEANSLLRDARWPQIAGNCVVLQEPAVSTGTIGPLLRFLQESTDLADRPNMVSQPGFVSSLAELVPSRVSLPEVISAFDVAVASTNPETNAFVADMEASSFEPGGRSLKAGLEQLVSEKNEIALADLLSNLGERRTTGATLDQLVRELVRATCSLIYDVAKPFTPHRARSGPPCWVAQDVALWSAVLIGWRVELAAAATAESRRAAPQQGVLLLHRLASDYCCRASDSSPLAGLWEALEANYEAIEAGQGWLPQSSNRLVIALRDFLDTFVADAMPAWLLRLQRMLTAAAKVDDGRKGCETPPAQNHPAPAAVARSFEDILGQAPAIAALRRRVVNDQHATPLILHGPEGVGKRTVAMLYAKARLCVSPSGGTSCNFCQNCRTFDKGQAWGLAGPYDASQTGAGDALRTVVQDRRTSSFAPARVIVLSKVDTCHPDILDMLLKILETPPTGFTFVLLAHELKAVRLAVQSRCHAVALKPLCSADAHTFIHRQIGDFSGLNPTMLRLLGGVGCGLPARLQAACLELTKFAPPTVGKLREALGLNWVEAAHGSLMEIMATYDDRSGEFLTAEVDAILLTRLKAMLLHLYVRHAGSDAAVDAAFLDLAPDVENALAEAFNGSLDFDSGPTFSERWRAAAKGLLLLE